MNWPKGVPRSPETRAKQSAALIGRKLSPEHVAKLTEHQRRYVTTLTPEQREKLGAHMRVPKTPELKARIGEGVRRAYAERKARQHLANNPGEPPT